MDSDMITMNDNNNLDLDSITPDSSTLGGTALFSLELLTDSGYGDDSAYLHKAFESLSLKPSKLNPDTLSMLDETSQTNIFNGSTDLNFQHCFQQTQQQEQLKREDVKGEALQQNRTDSFCPTDSMGCITPLFNSTTSLGNYVGAQQKNAPSSMSYSLTSDMMRTSSPSGSRGSDAPVYASIATSPLKGRALDFRTFLTKKQVSPSTLKENSVGVFVGQLPSTYSEEDTAALLRAIGADAGVEVHVRDVKSHNQRRTCAFVVANRGALPVLLGYSKRVLCDVSCVWVVERERAAHLKDYVYGFVRDHLRGVPKAALVLEELTPQCMRGRPSVMREGKSTDRGAGATGIAPENYFLATHNGNSVVASSSVPMNLILQGWNSIDVSSLSFSTIANSSGGSQVMNSIAAPGVHGLPPANIFTTPPSTSVVAPSPQLNYYIIGAPPNGLQPPSPSQVNTKPPATPASGVNGSAGMSLPSFVSDARSHYVGMPSCTQAAGGKPFCSVCLTSIGGTEAAYVSPYDKNVICMRCCAQQAEMSSNNLQLTRGMAPCMIPLTNFNNFSHLPSGNSSMLVHALPAYSSQPNPQPQLLSQVQFALPPPPPPPMK